MDRTRDIGVIILAALVAPWVFVYGITILHQYVELPLLEFGSKILRLRSRESVLSYVFLIELFSAFLCGALVGLPLGLLIRRNHLLLFAIFVLLCLLHLAASAFFGPDPQSLWVALSGASFWLFFIACGSFSYVGHRIQLRPILP